MNLVNHIKSLEKSIQIEEENIKNAQTQVNELNHELEQSMNTCISFS